MLYGPHIAQTAAEATAVIRITVSRAEIQRVMGPAYRELMDAVAAQGIATAGPWFTHHLRIPDDTFDFEVGVPVTAPVAATGRVQPGELRAAMVARTIHRGPYEGLPAAWGEFAAWIAAQGQRPAAELWERYLAGPESGADPAAWRTELNRPLVRTSRR